MQSKLVHVPHNLERPTHFISTGYSPKAEQDDSPEAVIDRVMGWEFDDYVGCPDMLSALMLIRQERVAALKASRQYLDGGLIQLHPLLDSSDCRYEERVSVERTVQEDGTFVWKDTTKFQLVGSFTLCQTLPITV